MFWIKSLGGTFKALQKKAKLESANSFMLKYSEITMSVSSLLFYMLSVDFDLVFAQTVSNRGVDFLRT